MFVVSDPALANKLNDLEIEFVGLGASTSSFFNPLKFQIETFQSDFSSGQCSESFAEELSWRVYDDVVKSFTRELTFQGHVIKERQIEILLGSWLITATQIFLDRYFAVSKLHNYGAQRDLIYLTQHSKNQVRLKSQSLVEFFDRSTSVEWNEAVLIQILNHFEITVKAEDFETKIEKQRFFRIVKSAKALVERKLHQFLLASVYTFVRSRPRGIYCHTSYFNREIWRELRKRGLVTRYRWISNLPTPLKSMSNVPRVELFRALNSSELKSLGICEDLFSNFLRQILPSNLLRNIEYLFEIRSIPRDIKISLSSNSFWYDENTKVIMAALAQNGGKIVLGQHGGHFGSALSNTLRTYMERIGDYILAWGPCGFSDNQTGKVIVVGDFRASTSKAMPRMHKIASPKRVLFPLNNFPMETYLFGSYPKGRFENEIFLSQQLSSAHLAQKLGFDSRVRLYQRDYGFNVPELVRRYAPGVKISNYSGWHEDASKSELIVHCSNTTTIFDTLNWDIPSLIFLQPSLWKISKHSEAIFQALEELGFLVRSIDALRDKLLSLRELEIVSWWQEAEIMEARDIWRQNFGGKSEPAQVASKIERLLK